MIFTERLLHFLPALLLMWPVHLHLSNGVIPLLSSARASVRECDGERCDWSVGSGWEEPFRQVNLNGQVSFVLLIPPLARLV